MQPEIKRENIKKILIVRSDNLGDVICTTPVIEALRRAFPDAFIAALVADYTKEALVGNPFLDRVYSYEKAKHSSSGIVTAWWRQWNVLREIKSEGFDLAFGVRSRFTKSLAWLVYMSKARYRVGHRPKNPSWPSSRYYNIFVDDEVGSLHEVERSLNIVRAVGVDIEDKRVCLAVGEDDLKSIDKFIEDERIGGHRLIAVHISSRHEHNRSWPTESYTQVIDGLSELPGVRLVMNWMDKDSQTARDIMDKVKVRPLVFKAGGLKSFAAFIKRMSMLVTLEGGAMHIGASQGTPTVAIFGRTSPEVWRPWGESNITLKNGEDAASVSSNDVVKACKQILAKIESQGKII